MVINNVVDLVDFIRAFFSSLDSWSDDVDDDLLDLLDLSSGCPIVDDE